MRALLSLLLVVGCSGSASAPTGFGVNITVDAKGLSAADRSQISLGQLVVTGDEPFSTSVDLHKPIQSGRVRFRYLPSIHSGTLTFLLEAQDGNGNVIATGTSAAVTLVDGHSVDALITLAEGGAPDLGAPGGDGGAEAGVQLDNGTACGQAADCASGFCVDGVCCESDCSMACHTCGLPGALGICNLAPSGTDPHNSCGDDGTPCGLDGTCDGSGGCRFRTSDTICQQQSCDVPSGMLSLAATCDGKGSCQAATITACAPYVCKPDGSDCFNDCQPDMGSVECQAPKTCAAGSCGPKPNGRACGGDSECQTGMCRDGVCCATDCKTACYACNVTGKLGTCSPVAAGTTAPDGACVNSLSTVCGPTHKCDGTGKCAFPPAGTLCTDAMCTSGVAYKANRCDGVGGCQPPSTTTEDCKPYRCYRSTIGSFHEAYCYTSCGSCTLYCSPTYCPPPTLIQADCYSGTCENHCSDHSKVACCPGDSAHCN